MTFHIRLVSPGDLTEHLVDLLLADSGVSNLVVLTGSARRPEGDAVQFDVPARSANVVLRRLEAFTDDRRGPITIQSVDAAIGEQATPPPGTAGRGADTDCGRVRILPHPRLRTGRSPGEIWSPEHGTRILTGYFAGEHQLPDRFSPPWRKLPAGTTRPSMATPSCRRPIRMTRSWASGHSQAISRSRDLACSDR